jgi:hypothetical protein
VSGATTRPDVDAVLGQLKGFQRDTVDYAFRRLYLDADSTHRFLVADEVGLGKTLVARGVIAKAIDHLWDKLDRIDIVYICSNAEIARQNINRLRPAGEDVFALASRITLLPLSTHELEERKMNFISFTPGTAFQLAGGEGVWRERVLLYWLLRDAWGLRGKAPLNVLQGWMGTERFREEVDWFPRSGPDGCKPWDATIEKQFLHDIEIRILEDRAAGRPDLRARFDSLCVRFGRSDKRVSKDDTTERARFVGDLRGILARTCLNALQPDLIILDEFQRFRELLDGEDEAAQLARDLFGYADATTEARVLLLSATPYKMYTLAHETAEDDHYRDFLRTVRFLTAKREGEDALPALLHRYRAELFALGDGGGEGLAAAKARVEASLRSVMARTERVGAAQSSDGMLHEVSADGIRLEAADVRSFTALQRVGRALDQPDVIEYWKSAPYLLNFMDAYKLKQALMDQVESERPAPELRNALAAAPGLLLGWEDVRRYREIDPANARLRAFAGELFAHETWRLLWCPPVAPYYALEEPFAAAAQAGFTKRLVFSAWTVVPKVLATLASYEAERKIFSRLEESPENTPEARERRQGLLDISVSEGRLTGMPVLGLLYPSPVLAEVGDPLGLSRDDAAAPASLAGVLAAVEAKLTGLLAEHTAGSPATGPADEIWYWAAPILLDLARDREAARSWLERPDLAQRWSGIEDASDEAASRWSEHVARAAALARGELPLGRPPADLAQVLAMLALAGPATVTLRSFWQVSAGSAALADPLVRDAAARTAWAFRSLFNQPEAMAILRAGRTEVPYWRRVLEYAAAGCLPAVLDEWVHLLREFEGLFDAQSAVLAEGLANAMVEVLGLRTSNLKLDEISLENGRILRTDRRLRARFVMRFGQEEGEDEKGAVRGDAVRRAFNSPFWPFALATTSVGQEGLDFHPYCHAVVHWNLPANPVDLEQREGRVHRYKGHAIRKNVAARFAARALAGGPGDPWARMFAMAVEEGDGHDRGLSPYWIFPLEGGAFVERHVAALPLSRDQVHLAALRRSLAVYRMVFGQPRQDDLLAYLLEHVDSQTIERSREALRINLTPLGEPGWSK